MANSTETKKGLSIDEISGDIIKKELVEVVKRVTGSSNIELGIEPGSKKGDNFMGLIYRILFKNSDDTDDSKKTSLILKIAPRDETRRKTLNVRNLFLREISMYDEVLSFFNEFQLSKGVNVAENGFNECAKCYSSLSDEMSESLFLEDLKLRQFEMINLRQEPLTFEHTSLLMKALGKFHAISFALKDQQPEKFKQLASIVYEHYWTMVQTSFTTHFKDMVDRFAACLKEENRMDLFEKFNKLAGDDPSESVFKLVSGELAEPYSVICHGDLTTNNAMYRKDEQGKPIEIQLFDWQFCRYASPITELVLYLLCSSSKELRDKHYDEFLKIYYGSLSDLLTRLGSDPQKLFPYDAFLDQCRKFGAYAAFVGSILVPLLSAELDSMPDIDVISESGGANNENIYRMADEKAYNRKVTDIFDDMARFGYI